MATKQVEPAYPPESSSWLVDPLVVEMVIDDSGTPYSVRSSAGIPDNVVRALMQWEFRPGKRNGKNAPFEMRLTIAVRKPLDEALVSTMRRLWYGGGDFNGASEIAAGLNQRSADAMERSIATDRNSVLQRSALLLWASALPGDSARNMKARQILALIQERPDAGVLAEHAAMIDPDDTINYQKGRDLWLAALQTRPEHPLILEHATNYLRLADPELCEEYLRKVVLRNGSAAVWLGELWALASIGARHMDAAGRVTAVAPPESQFAQRARANLVGSGDIRILLSAVDTLSNSINSLAARGGARTGATELCADLAQSAKARIPSLEPACEEPLAPSAQKPRIQQAKLLRQPRPDYPASAKAHGTQGTVRFGARIGADGAIATLLLLSGPLPLYTSAQNAVSRWVYSPTLLNGTPRSVMTTIDVNYTLSR